MNDAEKRITGILEKIMPKLPPDEKAHLLGFVEGLACRIGTQDPKANGPAA